MIIYCLSFDEEKCTKKCSLYKNKGEYYYYGDEVWENWQNFHSGKLLETDVIEITCINGTKAIVIKDNKLKYNMMKIIRRKNENKKK